MQRSGVLLMEMTSEMWEASHTSVHSIAHRHGGAARKKQASAPRRRRIQGWDRSGAEDRSVTILPWFKIWGRRAAAAVVFAVTDVDVVVATSPS